MGIQEQGLVCVSRWGPPFLGDEQKPEPMWFSWHVGLETPTGELVCAAVNPEVM